MISLNSHGTIDKEEIIAEREYTIAMAKIAENI